MLVSFQTSKITFIVSSFFIFLNVFLFFKAISRKLKALGVSPEKVTEFVNKDGLLNLLTVVQPEEIVVKAIPYIKQKFDVGEFVEEFDMFWKYFVETWTKSYDPEVRFGLSLFLLLIAVITVIL